ncbi:MAG: NAD(P)H-binding protein [Candidatus Omnitrophica bacterium]|nr:NAD(P)H-binding protein [Candidatus Omnitrophota bacterium]
MALQDIFITGSSGKIGSHITASLLAEGHSLRLLCRSESDAMIKHSRVRYVFGDLLDRASYASALEGCGLVLHAGGITHTNDESKYYDINSKSTLGLLEACNEHRVRRFIFISTRAIDEGGGAYSRSKAIAEKHVKASGIDWVILRLGEVYGIYDNIGAIDMLLKNIRRLPFAPVIGDGSLTLAPIHISDVVLAVTRVVNDNEIRNTLYNITGPESLTYNELLDIILAKEGKKIRIYLPLSVVGAVLKALAFISKNGPVATDQLPRLMSQKSDDISLAKKDFGFNPAKFSSMMAKHG